MQVFNQSRAMKFTIVISSVLLALSVAPSQYEAQIIEQCFWECGVEFCDYLDDFCTYDCHEICYPIAKKHSADGPSNNNGPSQIINGIIGKLNNDPTTNEAGHPTMRIHEQLADLNREQTANMGHLEPGRIGKHVKMRIENPAYETVRRGKVVLTRGSPPRGFAMFQDCLSGGKKHTNATAITTTPTTNQQPNLGSMRPGKQTNTV